MHLWAYCANNKIYISVQDFGIGIPEEIRVRVFERFFRASGSESFQYPGLGLGLYISFEIVRQHGGTITIDSEKDKGSIFTVSLPLRSV